MSIRSFADIIHRDSSLARLAEEAASQATLASAFNQILPPILVGGCQAVRIHNHELLIYTGTNSIAARLRLLAPNFLNSLAGLGYKIKSVKIRITPQQHQKNKAPKTIGISHQALKNIELYLPNIQHPDVRAALNRLLTHHRQDDSPSTTQI